MLDLGSDLAAALDPVAFAGRLAFDAETWQQRLLRSTASRVLVRCARQVGKTQTTSFKAVHVALYRSGSLVLIISPSQRQSDEMLLRVKALYRTLGRAKLAKDSGSELVLENGSRIVSLPGTEGTSRGFSGAQLIVLDEASRVEDSIFASVLPMVASDGAIWALSTPWGRRGWFYELHDDVANGWQRHKVTVYESGQYGPHRIAEVKAALGSYVFASDYECEFGDTDSQLFGTEMVRAAFTPAIKPLEFA
ncbi:terminase large subunit domain-containing protein [Cryobacterium sp. Y50]|uniref:terminase large subunit domain-containing protein n=1 Tax=Cryobacterium sp. Y50 TaxID=2048286 RepID=UPI001304EA32|nr:terminase family protein [Cryobacterium sp. Y50]